MPRQRRQKGSGSLSLLGNTYWATFYKGKRIQENTNSADREQAELYLQRRIIEVKSGPEGLVRGRATIDDICKLVFADYQMRQLRDRERQEWRSEANVKRLIGNLRAERFGKNQVRVYVETRRSEGAANATINRELAIVKRAFTLATQEEPPRVFRSPHIPKLEESEPAPGIRRAGAVSPIAVHPA